MPFSASPIHYWPTLLTLLGLLCCTNAWRVPDRTVRLGLYGIGGVGVLLLLANLAELATQLTNPLTRYLLVPAERFPLAIHSPLACGLLLGMAALGLVASFYQRLRVSLLLGVGAWYCQTLATQYLTVSQGWIYEMNGVLAIQSLGYGFFYQQLDFKKGAVSTKHRFFYTEVICGREHLLVVDGIGPLFTLDFDAQQQKFL